MTVEMPTAPEEVLQPPDDARREVVAETKLKIAVYAIALNEEKHVTRFCEAAKEADLIVVADTGSTDSTVALLEQAGAVVHRVSIRPWRFDDARNAVLALLPADIDVCVSLDLDEVLQPRWREEIERVWVTGHQDPEKGWIPHNDGKLPTRMRYGFDWGAGIQFQYEKVHQRHGFRWHHCVHEIVVSDREEERWCETQKLLVVHKPDNEKSRGQYLELLRISVKEDANCPRNAFYLARELSFHRLWNESIAQCKRYLELPRAIWQNERCYAMRVLAKCYEEVNDFGNALAWARQATSEAPMTREPWAALAHLCYRTERWPECFGAAMTCLSITQSEKVYTMDPSVWGAAPHDFASIAAYRMGLYPMAFEQAKKALEHSPEDFRLQANLRWCETAMKQAQEYAA